MSLPAIAVILNFSSGPSFGQAMIIGSGVLGVNVLADAATITADVSDTVQAVTINRGRNALSDVFQTGTCSVVIADSQGAFNPENTASPFFGLIQPLRKITITATDPATGIVWAMFAGYTTGFNYQQSRDVGIVSTTTITAVDGFRLANLATLTTVAGSSAGDLSGTRIGQILDAISWPASMRNIDAGSTTVQANPTTSATALAKLQQCTDSEYGSIYIDASGNMVFQDRAFTSSSIAATPTVFADDGSGIPYSQVKFLFNDDLVYNSGTVTRIGGSPQTSENAESIALYF